MNGAPMRVLNPNATGSTSPVRPKRVWVPSKRTSVAKRGASKVPTGVPVPLPHLA